jgi:pimeloyl-ACP methyl ester carboxylesterase
VVTAPRTQYAIVDSDHISYQVVGRGPRDVVLIPSWFSNVEMIWELPPAARVLHRLASFSRLLLFDRRGTGLSDPTPRSTGPFFEQFGDDLVAVLDAAGSTKAALVGCDGGGPVAILAAAMYPQRISALVLVNTFARMAAAPDYPAGVPGTVLDMWLTNTDNQWGGDPGFEVNAPSVAGDRELGAAFTRYLRLSASPGVARDTRQVLHTLDVRDILPAVQAPTLVIHRRGDRMIHLDAGRYLADHIPGARLVELPGDDHLFYFGDSDAIVDEIEEFVTGVRRVEADRVLTNVLFTDIVRSTELTARLGDRRWRVLLDEHDRVVAGLVDRFRGNVVKTTGDGVLATFDGPARAVRCAAAIRESVHTLGVDVRSGLHSGEVELRGDDITGMDITGMAVVIARRICDLAGAGEIVVSRTVTDLVVGSGLSFTSRGAQAQILKGVPGEWQLFNVEGG